MLHSTTEVGLSEMLGPSVVGVCIDTFGEPTTVNLQSL